MKLHFNYKRIGQIWETANKDVNIWELIMTSKSKQKGSQYERELVKKFEDAGYEAKRAWGSNGKSLGLDEEVDIVVNTKPYKFPKGELTKELHIQAKRRKALPKWIGLSESVDASVIREDRGEDYIIMELDLFIDRYLK